VIVYSVRAVRARGTGRAGSDGIRPKLELARVAFLARVAVAAEGGGRRPAGA